MKLRWTNITPTYDEKGDIIRYSISVDGDISGANVSATLSIPAEELDLSSIGDVTKEKLLEMLEQA